MSFLADLGHVFQHVTAGPPPPPPPPPPDEDAINRSGLAAIREEFQRPREQSYEDEFEAHWQRLEAQRLADEANGAPGLKLKEKPAKGKKEKSADDAEEDAPEPFSFMQDVMAVNPFTGNQWAVGMCACTCDSVSELSVPSARAQFPSPRVFDMPAARACVDAS